MTPEATDNYSYETSLPAYQSNQPIKKAQKEKVLETFRLLGGTACLLQVAENMEIPQSTISGRLKDLREDKEIMDTGTHIVYKGLKRKLFALMPTPKAPPANGTQNPLFN